MTRIDMNSDEERQWKRKIKNFQEKRGSSRVYDEYRANTRKRRGVPKSGGDWVAQE